jgi:hypothetical protein
VPAGGAGVDVRPATAYPPPQARVAVVAVVPGRDTDLNGTEATLASARAVPPPAPVEIEGDRSATLPVPPARRRAARSG